MSSGYLKEFPDYDGTVPVLEGWDDKSWHNDTCPSLGREIQDEFGTVALELFVDYWDREKRELPAQPRLTFYAYYSVEGYDKGLILQAETEAGLRKQAEAWYLDNVGDSILEGDLTLAEVLEWAGTMWGFHNSKAKGTGQTENLSRHIIETGGGCKAYSFDHAGHFIWITDTGGCALPKEDEEALLGIHNEDGSEGSVIEIRFEVERVLGFLKEIGADVYGPPSDGQKGD